MIQLYLDLEVSEHFDRNNLITTSDKARVFLRISYTDVERIRSNGLILCQNLKQIRLLLQIEPINLQRTGDVCWLLLLSLSYEKHGYFRMFSLSY